MNKRRANFYSEKLLEILLFSSSPKNFGLVGGISFDAIHFV